MAVWGDRIMNRREFLISGASALLLGGKGYSAPIRACLGAREILTKEEGEPFENPYITDGLVAQWDGTWNAGLGVHKSDITKWKDLSGNGNDVAIGNNVIDEDSMLCSSWMYANAVAPFIDYQREYTVEAVWKIVVVSPTAYTGGAVNCYYQILNSGMLNGAMMFGGVDYNNPTIPWNADEINYACNSARMIAGNTYSTCFLFHNGVYVRQANTSKYRVPEQFRIGQGFRQGGVNQVYAIRVYDRGLSDLEVEYNYQLDAERFGI
jgi:hypothetical protein